ncbi:MAG: autotransporter domain-containing protein, partial [Betaproteobacteria bacterium]|nr:autotransporter domain-containing protein [Betaproteobacteria bacterium]
MSQYKKIAAAVALCCSVSAWANSYSNIYIFGDSLSDAGAFTNLVAAAGNPTANKFTSNPGTVWAENLGKRYGLAVTTGYAVNPATAQFTATGGNDYAIGGARVTLTPGVFGASAPIAANIVTITNQITANLSQTNGAANPNALYAFWGGANDVFYQAGAVGLGLPLANASTAVLTAAADAVTQIKRLQTAGARNLVVIALPDMGVNPYATSIGPTGAGLLTSFSAAYNTALQQGLLAAGVNSIAYLDPRALFADTNARPAAYGFTNNTIPACGAISSLGCGPAQQIPGSSTYAFADGVHPSVASHKIISDWVYATLEAPSRFIALAALPLGRLGAQWRSIDDRLRNYETAEPAAGASTPGRQGFFVSGDYAPGKLDATATFPSTSGSGKSLTIGADRAWGAMIGGFALGLSNNDFDLGDTSGNNAGKVKYTETIVSAFGASRMENAYTDAVLSYATFDYDTTRNVPLGPLTASNTGVAKARQWGLKLGGGYNLKSGNLVHGPVAALSWEKVKVDGFTENGGVTAMSFGSQSRVSMRHRLGWQAVWQ